jgi:hypothetical protein
LRINGSKNVGSESKNGPDNDSWYQYTALGFIGSNSREIDLKPHAASLFKHHAA